MEWFVYKLGELNGQFRNGKTREYLRERVGSPAEEIYRDFRLEDTSHIEGLGVGIKIF